MYTVLKRARSGLGMYEHFSYKKEWNSKHVKRTEALKLEKLVNNLHSNYVIDSI